ncbi:chromosome transmission fidelity protein 8 homolog [Saccoglossus kowalevskii]|uniref:Chromosome transmission fidelity protein 8 homolog n=1 Tax=Saccoglossus kowalevskii TaxID=10224 RepID=A0ABM0GMC2_SACKO|nr:PREDICTED: chromosome transmission fidelity protein 8 homolog [Saccoglossus kowalevskii]
MVQLVIRSPAGGNSTEWMLIELQGELVSRLQSHLAGNFIGDLHFNHKGTPILIIGHHILYGKAIDLDKPYCVLIKNESSSDDVAMDIDHSSRGTHYTVKAVVKRKLQFRNRPKPIIANVPKKV